MTRFPAKFVASIIIIAATVFILNNIFSNFLGSLAMSVIKRPAGYTFSSLERFRAVAVAIENWKSLSGENAKLNIQNSNLISQLITLESVKDENLFLRKALNLPSARGAIVIPGGVFGFNLSPRGYRLLLNLGRNNGVKVGDIAITGEGVLIGRVSEAFENYSHIDFVTNLDFKSAAKINGTETQGIISGVGENALSLDLVTNMETSTEGALVVTSGNDLLPAGFIIGTIEHVESTESKVFKKIRVRPAASQNYIGKVLVVSKNDE